MKREDRLKKEKKKLILMGEKELGMVFTQSVTPDSAKSSFKISER